MHALASRRVAVSGHGQVNAQQNHTHQQQDEGACLHHGDDDVVRDSGEVHGRDGEVWGREEAGPDAVEEHELGDAVELEDRED